MIQAALEHNELLKLEIERLKEDVESKSTENEVSVLRKLHESFGDTQTEAVSRVNLAALQCSVGVLRSFVTVYMITPIPCLLCCFIPSCKRKFRV
jgi:FtsZ-binding cell division protein ZapB